MKHHNINKSGFTIIEVSLVLAIAGLIIVMVFIALPALQRQSRDAKRKEDTLTFIEAIKKYQQNNHGALPPPDININKPTDNEEWTEFYNKYLGDNFTNNSGEKYLYTNSGIFSCKKPKNASQGDSCADTTSSYPAKMILHQIYDNPKDYIDRIITFTGAVCDNENKPIASSNPRNVAVLYGLESGGVFCANT